MHVFGVWGVVFIVGLVITAGGWLASMMVLTRYRLHSSFHFVEGLRRLFGDEGRSDRKKALVRILIMVAGVAVLFVSVVVGDSERNAPCRERCRDAGYEAGRWRGSPHESVDGVSQGPRRCWCNNGEQDWSPEPLDLPAPD